MDVSDYWGATTGRSKFAQSWMLVETLGLDKDYYWHRQVGELWAELERRGYRWTGRRWVKIDETNE